jgi:ribose/xylose/arabinose/galactoside ABC-type transport system permease subunit
MAGINTRLTVFVAFVLAGALAGLAGFMFLARFGTITVVAGLGFELKSVAAAVVGGVNIFGGSGTVIGALIGAILVDLIDTSLVRWAFVSEFWREAVLGVLILLSVAADALLMRRLIAARRAREHARARRGSRGSLTRAGGPHHDRPVEAQKLGGVPAGGARPHHRRQHGPVAAVPDAVEPDQPVPAVDREDHRGARDDADHHQRGDRPLGRLDDGTCRLRLRLDVRQGVPAELAIVIVLLIGVAGGAERDLRGRVGLPSLVVTLATLIGFRGSRGCWSRIAASAASPTGSTRWGSRG